MAETPFEHGLQAMFDSAPRTPDAEAFALAVDRRIAGGVWLRAGLLLAFGLLGLALSLALAGPSIFDLSGLTGLTRGLAKAASLDVSAWSDVRVWAAILVLLGVGLLAVRPALTEA
jgi:hypothetical protein